MPKDELEQVLPGLKKKFLYYNDFAAKPVSDVFDLSGAQTLEAHDLASAIFLNAGKGNFTRINLPINLQLTPIFSFQNIGGNQWLAGGNFYDVLPYEGQYDSGSLLSFEFNNQKAVNARVLDIKGQVRDIKEIITKNGKVFVISKNNDSLSFYRSANEKK